MAELAKTLFLVLVLAIAYSAAASIWNTNGS